MRPGGWSSRNASIATLAVVGGITSATATGCGAPPASPACTSDPPRGTSLARFADVTRSSGVDFYYTNVDFKAGGLAVVDLDGDGLPEIVAGRRLGGLAMFHNLGALRFEQVSGGLDPAAAVQAIAAADLDNDGDIDLVLAGERSASIMANHGDGTFSEAMRFTDTGSTEHVLPVDLDGDGLLDLYFSNYDILHPTDSQNRMYLARGGLQFAFSGSVGPGLSWSATAFDVDGDGDQDLYIANDTQLPDFGPSAVVPTSTLPSDLFLRNDGPGADGIPRLTDIAATMGVGMTTPRSSMGGLLGDFNDDGRLDLYIPNEGAKKLFLRDPQGGFVESAAQLGVTGTVRSNAACGPGTQIEACLLLSWGAALSDLDLDGYDELVVVNGDTHLGELPPVLMFARGAEPGYHEVSPDVDCLDGRGLVVTDLDGDGDQDLVVSQHEGPLVVYENVGRPAAGTWLRVTLHGMASNRDGAGAVVTVHMASGRTQLRPVGAGGVINSATPAEAVFGLGTDQATSVEVRWPSGRHSEIAGPAAGSIVIVEPP